MPQKNKKIVDMAVKIEEINKIKGQNQKWRKNNNQVEKKRLKIYQERNNLLLKK